VFAAFAVLIVIICLVLTLFFINYQQRSLHENLIKSGNLFADILAHNSRIGVFAGNTGMLHTAGAGILERQEVLEVWVNDSDGNLMIQLKKNSSHHQAESSQGFRVLTPTVLADLERSSGAVHYDSDDILVFWSPIMKKPGFSQEDDIYFNQTAGRQGNQIIGFAGLCVDKTKLQQQTHQIMIQGFLFGAVFVLCGCLVSFFLVKMVAKPVHRLTESAQILGKSGTFDPVVVDTDDELGHLAHAFNTMATSLKHRESELRQSQTKLRLLSSRVLEAQEEERRRLSRELHDELGQSLAYLKIQFRAVEKKLPGQFQTLRGECEDVILFINTVIDNVRRLSQDLSPSMLDDLGLTTALKVQFSEFAKRNDIDATVAIDNIDNLLLKEYQINLYRFCQESLNNIYKHARAEHFSVTITRNNKTILLSVEDDGNGFDMDYVASMKSGDKGMGLTVMEERANMMNGDLDIQSEPGKGTRILLHIPLRLN